MVRSVPWSFDVGNLNSEAGTGKLYLAFASNNADAVPVVRVVSCQDDFTPLSICRFIPAWKFDSVGIAPDRPLPRTSLGQFQPVVAANRLNNDVAVSWYEDTGAVNAAGTRGITMRGRRATNVSATFGAVANVDPRVWSACPAAESPHYYGSKISSLVSPQLHTPESPPLVVTLYTNSSGGCDPTFSAPPMPTFDHHVESSRW